MAKAKDDKIIKDIIKRYGGTLDLTRQPYLIVEIIRQYGPRIDGGFAASCQPPGGPPKLPDLEDLLREFKTRTAEIGRLSASIEKATKARIALPAKTRMKAVAKPVAAPAQKKKKVK